MDPDATLRIAETLPNSRLVVILRDPIERALSHYRMSVRKGLESRSFAQAMNNCLDKDHLIVSRKLSAIQANENQTYIAWGEYGRCLLNYYNYFEKKRLLILFTADLESNPQKVTQDLFSFLELPLIESPSAGKRFHEGGDRAKIAWLTSVRRYRIFKLLWRLVPSHLSRKNYF